MAVALDINCDMGEEMQGCSRALDAAIMPYITSCNIACGFHSGSEEIIKESIGQALKYDVNIGAHFSYKDRDNFGRVSVKIEHENLLDQIDEQISIVDRIAENMGAHLHHIKPHGVLYHDLNMDEELINGFVERLSIKWPKIICLGMSGGLFTQVARKKGIKIWEEAFFDRGYASITELVPRNEEGALISDELRLEKRARLLLANRVDLVDGKIHSLNVDTVCVHGDTPSALSMVKLLSRMFSIGEKENS